MLLVEDTVDVGNVLGVLGTVEDAVVFVFTVRFLLLLWMDSAAAFLPTLYNLTYIAIGILVFNGGQSIGRVAQIGNVVEDIATVPMDGDVDAAAAADDDALVEDSCCFCCCCCCCCC